MPLLFSCNINDNVRVFNNTPIKKAFNKYEYNDDYDVLNWINYKGGYGYTSRFVFDMYIEDLELISLVDGTYKKIDGFTRLQTYSGANGNFGLRYVTSVGQTNVINSGTTSYYIFKVGKYSDSYEEINLFKEWIYNGNKFFSINSVDNYNLQARNFNISNFNINGNEENVIINNSSTISQNGNKIWQGGLYKSNGKYYNSMRIFYSLVNQYINYDNQVITNNSSNYWYYPIYLTYDFYDNTNTLVYSDIVLNRKYVTINYNNGTLNSSHLRDYERVSYVFQDINILNYGFPYTTSYNFTKNLSSNFEYINVNYNPIYDDSSSIFSIYSSLSNSLSNIWDLKVLPFITIGGLISIPLIAIIISILVRALAK